jgi:ATP-dependent RNA circularization protein (DNA/RNA ligase family)
MSTEYHKIQTVFKRDPATHHKTLLEGDWTLPEFEYLANNPWVFTEKVDGTNIRVDFINTGGGDILFGGRTDAAQIPATLLKALQEQFAPLKEKLFEMFPNSKLCLYGEGYGAKIQKGGGNYRQDQGFVLFDVKIGDWWLQRQDVEDIAEDLGIEVVPVIGEGTLHEMVEMARAGITSTWGNFQAEGIVARPKIELKTRSGHRLITKIKCKDFHKVAA